MILKNCRLIPELSGHVNYQLADVTIEDGKITSIVHESSSDNPAEDYIDCKGKTLMPGLIDLHMHLCTAGCGIGIEYKDDFDTMAKACRSAQAYLACGYTTIRDMGSTNGVASAVRDLINSGIMTGPNIISSSKMIIPSGMLEGRDDNTAYYSASGVTEIEKAVREVIGETRADVVKIYASGSAYNPGGEPQLTIMTNDEVRAAVRMAVFRKRKVAAHCHSAAAISMCIDEGVYTIEHGSYINDADIEKLKRGNSYLIPTMTPYYNNSGDDSDFRAKILSEMGQNVGSHMNKAYIAGLKLGFGTDSSDGNFHSKYGIEFYQRKKLCGMEDLDILLQATKNSAEIAGLSETVGEVREGLTADLILMNGMPDKDISVMYEPPEMVIKSGKIFFNNNILY